MEPSTGLRTPPKSITLQKRHPPDVVSFAVEDRTESGAMLSSGLATAPTERKPT
jgi:hypothetical protein